MPALAAARSSLERASISFLSRNLRGWDGSRLVKGKSTGKLCFFFRKKWGISWRCSHQSMLGILATLGMDRMKLRKSRTKLTIRKISQVYPFWSIFACTTPKKPTRNQSVAPPSGVQALLQGHGLRAISAVVGSGFHVGLTQKHQDITIIMWSDNLKDMCQETCTGMIAVAISAASWHKSQQSYWPRLIGSATWRHAQLVDDVQQLFGPKPCGGWLIHQ